MKQILVAGAGRIGCLIATLLANSGDYEVFLSDKVFGYKVKKYTQSQKNIKLVELDMQNESEVKKWLKRHKCDGLISCLPFYCNLLLAKLCREFHLHYFDLTEDVSVMRGVESLSDGAQTSFVPGCGLAPGFVCVIAASLMKPFDKVDAVKMRVGALPRHGNNALKYALTWSTEGLINEYANPCYGVVDGEETTLRALEGLETISIDGIDYEAFYTSGGLGSLVHLNSHKVNHMTYKTLRYPGHCAHMRLLMNDLKLKSDRETLKRILENAIPKTSDDFVIISVVVTGYINDELVEKSYVKRIYPQEIAGKRWSAIQVSTASGICSVVDEVFQNPSKYRGFVDQQWFPLEQLTLNRFGCYYL